MPDQPEHGRYSRQKFLKDAALGLAVTAAGSLAQATASAAPVPLHMVMPRAMPTNAHAALERLMAGNARFVSERSTCGPYAPHRAALAKSQSPFAVILDCADSRVPLATVFDAMPGDIFGVRLAGNFVDDNGLGSIEYAVAVLKAPLIMVLGHTSCGAVSAAVDFVKSGTRAPGHIQGIVEAIAPAAKASRGESGDWKHNATLRNVKDSVAALSSHSTILADALHAGKLAIAGALYDLATGKVTLH